MRGKILVSSALAIASLGAAAATRVQDFGDKTVYEFSVDRLELKSKNIDGQVFQEARAVGVEANAGVHFVMGAPELPVVRLDVIASDARDIVVTQRNLKSGEAVDAAALKPVVLSPAKMAGARYTFAKGEFSGSLPTSYKIEKVGVVRGQNKFLVTLYPVAFNAATKSLSIARSYAVEVKKAKVAKEDVDAAKALVFVVGDQFKASPSLAAYETLKKSQGLETSRINAGKMTPDEIRAAIQGIYAKNKNLAYVVVIGDDGDVPAHESDNISGITDHYYACMDADYNKDILTPDLAVGRISAANEAQLATILKKYTVYSNGTFRTADWLNSVSFLATDDRYEVAEGTHNYVIDTYTKSKGYTGVFPSAREALGGDKLYAITNHAGTDDVLKAVGMGRSIVDYSGHGANTYWAGPEFDQSNVRALKSSGLPFVISNACITGDFRVDESFAETWQRHEFGAVMYWGSMDSTYWDEDDILERRMFDGIFRDKRLVFGDITRFAMAELAKFYGNAGRSAYYFETYHMFGDPSMTLRVR